MSTEKTDYEAKVAVIQSAMEKLRNDYRITKRLLEENEIDIECDKVAEDTVSLRADMIRRNELRREIEDIKNKDLRLAGDMQMAMMDNPKYRSPVRPRTRPRSLLSRLFGL